MRCPSGASIRLDSGGKWQAFAVAKVECFTWRCGSSGWLEPHFVWLAEAPFRRRVIRAAGGLADSGESRGRLKPSGSQCVIAEIGSGL
jgi:hypothetical protein